jgi:Ion channel
MDASIKRMFKIMALSLLFLHLSSCFYFLIAKLEDADVTWVSYLGLE